MLINLAAPLNLTISAPALLGVTFTNSISETFLFGDEEIDIICHVGWHTVGCSWRLARNGFQQGFCSGIAEPQLMNAYKIRVPSTELHPGFYDLHVAIDQGNGQTINGRCTFGYRVDEIQASEVCPQDFRAFWEQAVDSLDGISLAAVEEPTTTYRDEEIDEYNVQFAALPRRYDPDGIRCDAVESCKVSFASVESQRIYGWLAKPVGEGPFPAMLVLPGAGCNARPRPLEHARHGYVALDIQVHGQDVDLDEYTEPDACRAAWDGRPEHYYHYRIYRHCIQAVNYLASRPDVDPNRIVVVGGSQGGRLSIVTAALDRRIAAAVPGITHFANLSYVDWADACNTSVPADDGMALTHPPALAESPEVLGRAYYDVLNFAPHVHCPVLMNAGMVDRCSLVTTVYAAYRELATPDKELVLIPGIGHDWLAEFDRQAWRWLDRQLASDLPLSEESCYAMHK